MPSIERVRFTSSGTEAHADGAAAGTGVYRQTQVVRFTTNFHGWHDHVAFGVGSHHDGTPTPGVLGEVADNVLLCAPGDTTAALHNLLSQRSDVAAVIIEPTGATWGTDPRRRAVFARVCAS